MEESILGVSASHNASACVLEDGNLSCAIQLERITRVKNDGQPILNSEAAISYCLSSAGKATTDLRAIGYNIQNLVPTWNGLSSSIKTQSFSAFDPFSEKSYFVSHHLGHAFAAFFASPFDEALVLVIDGSGGSVVGSKDDLLIQGPYIADYLKTDCTSNPKIHTTSIYKFSLDSFELLISPT